ncbi:MAG: hypothetical protein WAL42_06390, partial [Nitrososphaeraceae archaeon]
GQFGSAALAIEAIPRNSTFMRNISEVLLYRLPGPPVPQISMLLPLDFVVSSLDNKPFIYSMEHGFIVKASICK